MGTCVLCVAKFMLQCISLLRANGRAANKADFAKIFKLQSKLRVTEGMNAVVLSWLKFPPSAPFIS